MAHTSAVLSVDFSRSCVLHTWVCGDGGVGGRGGSIHFQEGSVTGHLSAFRSRTHRWLSVRRRSKERYSVVKYGDNLIE